MGKLVQPFGVELRRFGMAQGYTGKVVLEAPGSAQDERALLDRVLAGLRQFKGFCAEQDAVRVCGGGTVMHVAETLRVHMERLGLAGAVVHLVELGQEWTAEPELDRPQDPVSEDEEVLRALHIADTARSDPRNLAAEARMSETASAASAHIATIRDRARAAREAEEAAAPEQSKQKCSQCGIERYQDRSLLGEPHGCSAEWPNGIWQEFPADLPPDPGAGAAEAVQRLVERRGLHTQEGLVATVNDMLNEPFLCAVCTLPGGPDVFHDRHSPCMKESPDQSAP